MTVGFSASSASFGGHSDLSHVHKEKKRGVCLSAGRGGGLLSEGAAPAKEAALTVFPSLVHRPAPVHATSAPEPEGPGCFRRDDREPKVGRQLQAATRVP